MAAWPLLLYRQFSLRMVYDRQAFQQDSAKISVTLEGKKVSTLPLNSEIAFIHRNQFSLELW